LAQKLAQSNFQNVDWHCSHNQANEVGNEKATCRLKSGVNLGKKQEGLPSKSKYGLKKEPAAVSDYQVTFFVSCTSRFI